MKVKDLQELYNSLKLVITELSNRITSLEKNTTISLTNHASEHRSDKIFKYVSCALVILMFCFLKWGN